MIAVFDANAFYTYFGRKKLDTSSINFINEEKFQKEINKVEQKYIATSSFIEMLVRFKDDGNKLYQIMKFIKKNKIGMFNNVKNETNYISQKTYDYLLKNMDPNVLKKFAYSKINSKVELEANYTFLFILFIVSSFLNSEKDKIEIIDLNNPVFNSCKTDNKEDFISELMAFLLENVFIVDREDIISRLSQILKIAYEDADVTDNINGKKVIKEHKIEVMSILEKYIFIFENCIKDLSLIEEKDFSLISIIQRNRKAWSNRKDSKKKDGDHIIAICSKMLKNNEFNYSFYENKINGILQKSLSQSQANYISYTLLNSWINNGAQIKKNDIYDVLLLSILDSSKEQLKGKELFLITFDKKIMKFMKNTNISNWRYLNEFEKSS